MTHNENADDHVVLIEEEEPICSGGWSMTIGELRTAIQGLPEDWEVVLDAADVEDCEIAELHIHSKHEPTKETCGLLVLSAGQVITSEYDYHRRLDASFDDPSHPSWDERAKRWRTSAGG